MPLLEGLGGLRTIDYIFIRTGPAIYLLIVFMNYPT